MGQEIINSAINILEHFDKFSIDTKIILLILAIVCIIGLFFLLKLLVVIIKSGLNFGTLFKYLKVTAKVIKDYELHTIAGLINLIISSLLIILTIGVFLSFTFASFIGFNQDISSTRFLFVIITVITSFASMWGLYKFYKISRLVI